VSLIMLYINNGYVVFSIVDVASQRRFNVAFNLRLGYVHDIPRREHVFHLVPTIFGVSFVTQLIHLLTFCLRFFILGTRFFF
jgi:hypothetical protein